jgi:dolichyl-phosphate beta-glucosyltransferase
MCGGLSCTNIPGWTGPDGRCVTVAEHDATQMKTAIVIPCFNEAGRLRTGDFSSFVGGRQDVDFIFVNDGSSDETSEVLRDICAREPRRLFLVDLPVNSGKAEAVRQGFLKGFDLGYDLLGFWDADLATPLAEISSFRDILSSPRVQIVLGSRVKLLGRSVQRSEVRHYLGRIFAMCASLVLHLPVYDTQCGAKLFRNSEALRKVFAESFTTRWIFDVEILARFLVLEQANPGLSLEATTVEHPLREWHDVPGSKLKWHDFVRSAKDLTKIFFYLRRSRRSAARDHT